MLAFPFASCFVNSTFNDGFANNGKNGGTEVEEGIKQEVGVNGAKEASDEGGNMKFGSRAEGGGASVVAEEEA